MKVISKSHVARFLKCSNSENKTREPGFMLRVWQRLSYRGPWDYIADPQVLEKCPEQRLCLSRGRDIQRSCTSSRQVIAAFLTYVGQF